MLVFHVYPKILVDAACYFEMLSNEKAIWYNYLKNDNPNEVFVGCTQRWIHLKFKSVSKCDKFLECKKC